MRSQESGGVRHEPPDLLGISRVQCFSGEVTTRVVREPANLGFDGGNGGKADAQLVHAEPDQNRHGLRIAGKRAADADPSFVRVCARDGEVDEPQHGGV